MTSTIGLEKKKKKVCVGTDITIKNARNGKVVLIILAINASHTTKKMVYDKAKFYNVEVIEELHSTQISNALGKEDIKVIGITDRGFSQLLMDQRRK